jgi:hypothetical protein
MAMNTAKRKELIAALKGNEPLVTVEKYGSDFLRALNYYNAEHDDKDKKKWLISHVAKSDKKLAIEFLKIDEHHFRHAGIIARLIHNGSDMQEKELNYLNDRIEFLKSQIGKRQKSEDKADKKAADVAKETTNVVSIQQRMDEKAHDLAGEIEGAIDDFVLNKASDFSAKNYLLTKQVAAPIAKRIGDFYVRRSAELREAIEGKDDQLKEGYSHFTKRELKKFADFIDSIIADCQQMVQTAKATRAPRMRKEKPASVQVAKMKICKEFAELNLKSVKAETIIGSSEVWFYNTKYRRVGVYKGDNGGTVAVKGTTIIGFSVSESKQWTLRKPEEFFKGLSLGKRALNNIVKNIKTKAATPNGRFNEETILLGAF